MRNQVAAVVLASGCGFGAGVWLLMAAHSTRWRRWAFGTLAAAYTAAGVVLVGLLAGHRILLPGFTQTILFGVIIGIPPWVHLVAWLHLRRTLDRESGDD